MRSKIEKETADCLITMSMIKSLVESKTRIKDISTKTRYINIIHARCVYYELCMTFKEELGFPSLAKIGSYVDLDHATVLHGRKKFAKLYCTKKFLFNNVYQECIEYLDEFIDGNQMFLNEEGLTEIQVIRERYEVRLNRLSSKYREVITALHYKLTMYRKNEFVKRALELEPEDIIELEEKFNVFFKVKKALKKQI